MTSEYPAEGDRGQAAVEVSDDGSDLVKGAFDLPPIRQEISVEKQMRGWHRPRKHYCRIHLWCHNVRKLIKQLGLASASGTRRLRYLTLPGDELLDVRTIHGVCERERVPLEFLGFNTALAEPRRTEAHISWSEVRNLEFICEEASRVEMLLIEDITNKKSLAYQRVIEHAPFDIINLDLCDSVAKKPPKTFASTLQALTQIVRTQREQQARPWLLFLTTHVGIDTVDSETAKLLLKRIIHNALDERFAQRFHDQFPFGVEQVEDHIQNLESLDPENAIAALSVGLAKWLLGLCTSEEGLWKVELVGCLSYKVAHPKDMVSFAFRISRAAPGIVDPTGITVGTSGQPTPSEVEQAISLLKPLSGTIDVDELLASNADLRERTLRQTQDLLSQARHNKDDHMNWLKSIGDIP